MSDEAPFYWALRVLFLGLLLAGTSACMNSGDPIGVTGSIPFEGNLEIRR